MITRPGIFNLMAENNPCRDGPSRPILPPMLIPLRIVRADAEDLDTPRRPTHAEIQAKERIRRLGRNIIGNYGRAALTTARLAGGLNMSLSTFRRHYADIDALLAELIADELRRIARLFGNVPQDAPDRQAACRAVFLDATRNLGALAEGYRLIVRDMPLLPEDLRLPLERSLAVLGARMAGPCAGKCLALMAVPCLSAAEIEHAVRGLEPSPAHETMSPEPDPAPCPEREPAPAPAAEPVSQMDRLAAWARGADQPEASQAASPLSLDMLAAARALSRARPRPPPPP